MIKQVTGNVLNSTENIICQSVNYQGVMGAGLAIQIVLTYPHIVDRRGNYITTIREHSFEEIKRHGIVAWYTISENKFIASIFGQENFGRKEMHTDYLSLANGLSTVKLFAQEKNMSVAIPYGIGCGLGGGSWSVVKDIIKMCFSDSGVNVTIYRLEKYG